MEYDIKDVKLAKEGLLAGRMGQSEHAGPKQYKEKVCKGKAPKRQTHRSLSSCDHRDRFFDADIKSRRRQTYSLRLQPAEHTG